MRTYQVARPLVRWPKILIHICLIVGAVLMMYPIVWMLSASFKPENTIFSDLGLWPKQLTFQNYVSGWTALGTSLGFGTFFWNSFLVSVGAVIGNIISCSMVAYAFARLKLKFKPLWFAIMLGTVMLPYHAIVVPQYILFKSVGWINTFLPLIVPKFLATDAFFIFLMIQFMRSLPRELDEAAKMDGCGPIRLFWRVILPLTTPALVTTAIFTFIWTWSDFFSQLIFLNTLQIFTLPVALRTFLDSTGTSSYGGLFAMSILSLLPIFGFFLTFQRLLTEGISTTGMKG